MDTIDHKVKIFAETHYSMKFNSTPVDATAIVPVQRSYKKVEQVTKRHSDADFVKSTSLRKGKSTQRNHAPTSIKITSKGLNKIKEG